MPECYIIEHADFSATILRQGAQLISFTPTGGEELFWSAKLETFQEAKAFRGGVPICWPWFGKQGTPSHGFARTESWELAEKKEGDADVYLRFTLQDSPETRAIWPHAFTLTLEMTLSKEKVILTLHIDTDAPTTGALHSYVRVHDISHVSIKGLGECYNDSLSQSIKQAPEITRLSEETDRIYTSPKRISELFEDEALRVSIAHEHHSDVVLWNPWNECATKFADMQENDYTKMVCIETARITKPLQERDSFGCCFLVS